MRKSRIKHKVYVSACVLGCVLLMGCGEQNMEVVIEDGYTETRVAVREGETVEQVLERAEVQVNKNDTVKPEKDTKLTKQNAKIFIERSAAVTIENAGQITNLELSGKTVQDALDMAGVTLGKHDYLNHAPEAFLENGMEISVISRMEVAILVDGETRKCLTGAADVESLLEEQNIKTDKKDRVKPERKTTLQEGMEIIVERVSVKEITVKEPVPFETQIEYSNAMYQDQSVEKTPGVEGEKEVTYQVTYVDGKEEKREVISEKIIKEPVPQVVTQGTKQRRRIVSKQKIEDCDGSGHGYYVITWSDGTVEYQDY